MCPAGEKENVKKLQPISAKNNYVKIDIKRKNANQ
jgi:hypothetical protein